MQISAAAGIGVSLCLLTVCVTPAFAETLCVRSLGGVGTTVYDGPGYHYRPVGMAPSGVPWKVLERHNDFTKLEGVDPRPAEVGGWVAHKDLVNCPVYPCPEGQIRHKGKCQQIGVLPGSKTGEKGGFIQMHPTKPAKQQHVIQADVDLHDSPGGTGKVIGMLTKGATYPSVSCRADNWCQIPGKGWIWGDFVQPH
jgi:hypothetical protein